MESDASADMRARGFGKTPVAASHQEETTPLQDVFIDVPADAPWRWIVLMDDFFTTVSSFAAAEEEYSQMEALMEHLGPTLARKKKEIGQVIAFAGVVLDSVRSQGRMSDLKVAKYRRAIEKLLAKLRSTGSVSRKRVAKVVGQMNFAASWVGLEPYLIDCIYVLWPREQFGPAEMWKHVGDPAQNPTAKRKQGLITRAPVTKAAVQAQWQGDERLTPDQKAIECWEMWVASMTNTNGVKLHLGRPAPGRWRGQVAQQVHDLVKVMESDHNVCTTPSEGIPFFRSDASGKMGAGVFGAASFAIKLNEHRDTDWHIMFPEMEAACFTPIHFRATMFEDASDKSTCDRRVLGLCDNLGDVFAWNKGWSSNAKLTALIRKYKRLLSDEGIELVLVYINTLVNPADAFTRGKQPFSEAYRLRSEHWDELVEKHGFDHEAFGDTTNNRCASFGSVHRPFGSVSLEGKKVFANSPFSKMLKATIDLKEARTRWRFDTWMLVPTKSAGTARCMPQVIANLRAMGGVVTSTYPEGTHLFEKQKTWYLEHELDAGPCIVPTGRVMWDVDLWYIPSSTANTPIPPMQPAGLADGRGDIEPLSTIKRRIEGSAGDVLTNKKARSKRK